MRRLALAATLLMVAGCDEPEVVNTAPAAPAAVETAESVVRALYASENVPNAEQARNIFTTELAEAIAPATGRSRIDWDYRYDVQHQLVHATNVTFTAASRSRVTSRVTVNFTNSGQADSMVYDLCLRDDGHWRIRDVRDPDQSINSLRPQVHLGPVRGTACP